MGIEVETKIIPDENGHRREHTITSEYECRAYDCGFAVSNMDADKCVFEERDGLCSVSNKTAECMVSSDSGRGRMINANPNTCVVSPKTLIPAVEYNVKKGVIKVSCTVREKVKL